MPEVPLGTRLRAARQWFALVALIFYILFMQTVLSPSYQDRPEALSAQAIVRQCVHCGFCTATCPTYELLGDELDGPRGRIELIAQVLQGAEPTRKTQLHLDRCLGCRGCQTTCPSGVDYGHLLDLGRELVDEKVPRSATQKTVRWLLKEGLTSPAFGLAMHAAQSVRAWLPAVVQRHVPPRRAPGLWPTQTHARKVLLLAGCVQPAMMPRINHATARVLDAAGITSLLASGAGCCGALRFHLNDPQGAKAQMRANIDAWWPYIESGDVQAIVMTASGCGSMVKDYGHALSADPAYAAKAARVSALTQDLSELLPVLVPLLKPKLAAVATAQPLIGFHAPCTLQHGQGLRSVPSQLAELGWNVQPAPSEAHLCCGSGGAYAVLEPGLSTRLRDRKLQHLQALRPDVIASANVGCITHLQSGTTIPVRHWVELLDDALFAQT